MEVLDGRIGSTARVNQGKRTGKDEVIIAGLREGLAEYEQVRFGVQKLQFVERARV
jgi:hypothetical protein